MSSSFSERSRKRSIARRASPPGAKESSCSRHPSAIGVQVERRAVLEERAPLRIERDQFQLVVEVAAGLGEDPLQDRGHQQDRRPHVEAIAVDLEHGGLAPEPVVLLEEHDP